MPESKKRKKSGSNKPVVSDDAIRPAWNDGIKHSPRWYAPTAGVIMLLGLLWIVMYYALAGTRMAIIVALGNWHLLIGFGLIMVGFIMLMWWR